MKMEEVLVRKLRKVSAGLFRDSREDTDSMNAVKVCRLANGKLVS